MCEPSLVWITLCDVGGQRPTAPGCWLYRGSELGGLESWCEEVPRVEVGHQTDIIAVVHGRSSLHHRPHVVCRVHFQNLLGDDLMSACSHGRDMQGYCLICLREHCVCESTQSNIKLTGPLVVSTEVKFALHDPDVGAVGSEGE